MSPRNRNILYVGSAAVLVLLWALGQGLLTPDEEVPEHTPQAVSRGRTIFDARCARCHDEKNPIAPHVAGWPASYAYDAIARLPELQPAMPPFQGTRKERADLASYLESVGADVAPELAGTTARAPQGASPPAPAAGILGRVSRALRSVFP